MMRIKPVFLFLVMGILFPGCLDPVTIESDPTTTQLGSEFSIKTFSFIELPQSCTINEANLTINVTVPYGTRVDSLTPVFTHSGVSVSPASGAAADFTSPVEYTVTSAAKTTRKYRVKVTVTALPAKTINHFFFPKTKSLGVIDTTNHTIAITIPDSVDIKMMVAAISFTGKAIQPDTAKAQDFSKPVKYTVTATDGQTQEYVVTCQTSKSSREIQAFFSTPRTGNLVNDSTAIVVSAQSTYQISSVSVRTGQTTIPLTFGAIYTYTDSPKAWVGTFHLKGLPTGTRQFVATVTDIFNNQTDVSVSVIYDPKPNLTLASPYDGSIARPTIFLQASTTDDDPSSPPSLLVTANGINIATGIGSLSTNLDLSAFEGKLISLGVTAKDSRNQTATILRNLYVESSPHLVARGHVNGSIWDVAGTRILYLDRSGPTPALKITDTASQTTQTLETTADLIGTWGGYGYLTSQGAIYARGKLNNTTSPYCWVYEWKNGTLTQLSGLNSSTSLLVAGDWAIYNNDTQLWLRNLATGTSKQISTTAINFRNSIAPNGDVAFATLNKDIYLWHGDTAKMLTAHSSLQRIYPTTDGIHVVYRRMASATVGTEIVVSDGHTEIALTTPTTAELISPNAYAAAGGTVAFLAEDATSTQQVWRYNASGKQQLSFFGTSSVIQGVLDDGSVVFAHGSKRYFAPPGSAGTEIGSNLGTAIVRGNKVLIVLGATVLDYSP